MFKSTITTSLLAAALVSMGIAPAIAQDEIQIGYIDSQRIFAEYKETQDAERIYQKEVDQWKAQAQAMEQEIVRMQDELRAQSLMLSEEKQREKKLTLDKKLEDYQRFMAETFGDDGIAANRNRELTQPIVEKINRILEGMAEERGLAVVFDIANANIVYAKKEFDLTQAVLDKLNEIGGAAAPAGDGGSRLTASLKVSEGGWIAARAYGSRPSLSSVWKGTVAAHTSPVYVQVDGRRRRDARAIDHLDAVMVGALIWFDTLATRASDGRHRSIRDVFHRARARLRDGPG